MVITSPEMEGKQMLTGRPTDAFNRYRAQGTHNCMHKNKVE